MVITEHGRPVAVLKPYEAPAMTSERQAAIDHAAAVMEAGLPWGEGTRRFSRDDMHDR